MRQFGPTHSQPRAAAFITPRRFVLLLLATFAMAAVALTAIGIGPCAQPVAGRPVFLEGGAESADAVDRERGVERAELVGATSRNRNRTFPDPDSRRTAPHRALIRIS